MNREQVIVYQSIALGDIALMRHGTITFEPHHTASGFRFLVTMNRPGHQPSGQYGMDELSLAYTIIRGLAWAAGSGGPHAPPSCPSINEMCRVASKVLGRSEGPCNLPLMVADIAELLDKHGYLITLPVPRDPDTGTISSPKAYPVCLPTGEVEELARSLGCKGKSARSLAKLIVEAAREISRRLSFLENKGLRPCFKSLHGEIARSVENARSLPDRYVNTGIHIPPILIEPRGPRRPEYLEEVVDHIKAFLANQGCMQPEETAEALRDALIDAGITGLTAFQKEWIIRYLESYNSLGRTVDGVLVGPTGSGKTIIFTIVTLTLAILSRCLGTYRPIVIGYPRKTLESEQVQTLAYLIGKFNNKISSINHNLKINILVRDGNSPTLPRSRSQKEHETIPLCRKSSRKEEKLNPRLPELEHKHCIEQSGVGLIYRPDPDFILDINADKNAYQILYADPRTGELVHPYEAADIIVTNYSMLFREYADLLAMMAIGGQASRLAQTLGRAILLVLDEVHMAVEQKYSKLVQNISLLIDVLREKNVGPEALILSSATLSDEAPQITNQASFNNVLAIIPERAAISSPSRVYEEITGRPPTTNPVYVDYYKSTSADLSGESSDPEPATITFWVLVRPSLQRKPLTTLLESLISIINILQGVRARNETFKPKAIVFFESKRSLKEAAQYLYGRYILESGDLYDRLLLTKTFNNKININRKEPLIRRVKAQKLITEPLTSSQNTSILEALADKETTRTGWKPYYTAYHNLSTFLTWNTQKTLLNKTLHDNYEEEILKIVCKDKQFEDCWLKQIHDQARDAHLTIAVEGNYIEYIKRNKNKDIHYILVHHGDVTPRLNVDELIQKSRQLILILSTSTLEVGLNIEDVIATIHYKLPVSPGRIIQQVGRSGRKPSTGYIRMGIAIIRPNAWETPKLMDVEAIKYFHLDYTIQTNRITDNPREIAKLCLSISNYKKIVDNQANTIEICKYIGNKIDKKIYNYANQIINLFYNVLDMINNYRYNGMKHGCDVGIFNYLDINRCNVSIVQDLIKKYANKIVYIKDELDYADPLAIISKLVKIYENNLDKIIEVNLRSDRYGEVCQSIVNKFVSSISQCLYVIIMKIYKIINKYSRECNLDDDLLYTSLIPPGYYDLIELENSLIIFEKILSTKCKPLFAEG